MISICINEGQHKKLLLWYINSLNNVCFCFTVMRILGENVNCLKYNVTFISMQKQTLNHCNFLYANFIKKKKSPWREIMTRMRFCQEKEVQNGWWCWTQGCRAAADVLILLELVFALSRDCVWWMSSYGSV